MKDLQRHRRSLDRRRVARRPVPRNGTATVDAGPWSVLRPARTQATQLDARCRSPGCGCSASNRSSNRPSSSSRRTDRRCRPQRLRQVEPARGPALGDGRDLAQVHARSRHGRRDLRRHQRPARRATWRRSRSSSTTSTVPRRPSSTTRRDRDHAPHRARGRLRLPHQRPRCARSRRQDPVRGRSHRRTLARARPPGPDRRDRQRQARAAPPHPRGRRRRRRTAQPAPRCRAAPQGGRDQPRPARRHSRLADLPDREPEAAGPPGAALQGAFR